MIDVIPTIIPHSSPSTGHSPSMHPPGVVQLRRPSRVRERVKDHRTVHSQLLSRPLSHLLLCHCKRRRAVITLIGLTKLIIGANNPNDNLSNRVSAPNPRTGRDCNVTLVLALHHREAPMINPTNRIHGSDDLSNASQTRTASCSLPVHLTQALCSSLWLSNA